MTPETNGAIRADLKEELGNLSKLVDEMENALSSVEHRPNSIELRAIASILHDYYTGLARVFELIGRRVDGDVPEGSEWYQLLLRRMTTEVEGKRPPVIGDELATTLKDYLDFRHLFRHTYGFDLNWNRFDFLAGNLPDTHERVEQALEKFMEFLSKLTDNSDENG